MKPYVRAFAEPDQLVELERVRSAMVTGGGITVSYNIQQPGWRWSRDIRPLVKTEWCEVRHVDIVDVEFKGITLFLDT